MAIGPWIAPILGVLGSLFKGKKTQQNTQMDPRQNYAYGELLKLLLKKNQQGSDPMNQVRNMFYGQQQPQQPLVGMPSPPQNPPRPY